MSDVITTVTTRLKLEAPANSTPGLKQAADDAARLDKAITSANDGLKKQKALAQDVAETIRRTDRNRITNQAVVQHYELLGRTSTGMTVQELAQERFRATIEGRAVDQARIQLLRAQGMDAQGNRLPGAFQSAATIASRVGSGAVGTLGVAAAGAVATMYGAAKGMDYLGRMAEVDAQPLYMTEVRRKMAKWETNPLNGWLVSAARRWQEGKHFSPIQQREALIHEPRMAMLEAQAGMEGPKALARFETMMERETARAAKEIRYARMPSIDRTTSAGMQQHAEQLQLLAAGRDVTEAQRGVTAMKRAEWEAGEQERRAQNNLSGAMRDRSTIEAKLKRLQEQEDRESRQADQAQGISKRGWFARHWSTVDTAGAIAESKGRFVKPLNELAENEKVVEAARNRLEQEKENHKRAQVELGTKELQLANATLGVMRTQLQILEQREKASSATSIGLAMMGPGGRMQGLQAARFIRERGFGAATPEIIQYANAFDPEFVQRRAEAFGQNTPEFKRWRVEAGSEAGMGFRSGPVAELRRQQDELTNRVGDHMQKQAEDFSSRIATTFERAFDKFLEIMDKKLQAIADRRRTEQWQARQQN